MAEKKVIELEIHSSSLSQLKADLKIAQNEVASLSEKFGATSQEAINAAKHAAEIRHQIGETKKLTDAFHPEGTFNALSGSLEGVVRGLETYTGAMGLIGVESKDVEEAILKVQSVMAFAEGIKGIKESADSFKQLGAVIGQTAIGQKLLNAAQIAGAAAMRVLNVVMAANPILLVVTAIGALSGALYLFSQDTETAAEANDRLNASLTRMNESVEASNEKLTKAGENRLKILESQGASEETLHKQRLQNINNEEKARRYSLKAEEQTLKHKRAIYKQALEEEDYELAKTIQGEIKASEKRYKKLNSQHTDYVTNKTVENNKFSQYEKDQLDKAAEKAKEVEKDLLEKRKERYQKQRELWEKEKQDSEKFNDDLLNILDKRSKKEDGIIRTASKTKQQWAEENAKFTDKLREQEFNDAKGYLEADLINNANNFDAKRQLLELQYQKDISNKNITEGELTAIEAKYAKERKQINKDEQDQKLQSAQNVLSTLSSLTELFAGKSEKQQKKAFQIQKAINIASAVIDTYKAANAALASSPPPFNFIAMAATITAGLVNVKKIASQEFQGGATGGGATSASAPSAGAGSSPSVIAPNFNIVGNNQATNPLSMLGSQPIQAYVVSGEVTTAQSLDRNRMNTATFG